MQRKGDTQDKFSVDKLQNRFSIDHNYTFSLIKQELRTIIETNFI